MMVDQAFHSGPHAYTLREIRHVDGLTLCVDIKRDFYIVQSHAKVEVLTPQLTWTMLTFVSPNEWHKDIPSTAKDATPLEELVADLINRGRRILSLYTACHMPVLNEYDEIDEIDEIDELDDTDDVRVGPEFAAALDTIIERRSLSHTNDTDANDDNHDSDDDDVSDDGITTVVEVEPCSDVTLTPVTPVTRDTLEDTPKDMSLDGMSDNVRSITVCIVHTDAATMGARIKRARLNAGMTQKDLGERCGLNNSVLSRLESGARKVTIAQLADIAAALELSMSAFTR